MTVVSLVASKLRTPVQPLRAAGARRLHDRAPAGRVGLPRDDIACRLRLPIAQALARLLAAGRRQRMPPTVKDLSFSETAPTETPNLDPRSRNDNLAGPATGDGTSTAHTYLVIYLNPDSPRQNLDCGLVIEGKGDTSLVQDTRQTCPINTRYSIT